MKFKVSGSSSPSSARGVSYHELLSSAVKEAERRVEKYGKRYYIYRYMPGDPSVKKYPFWSKVRTVAKEGKK